MQYHVIVAGENSFIHVFDGEPQINLTFEHKGRVYKVVTRAHDEHETEPSLHAEAI